MTDEKAITDEELVESQGQPDRLFDADLQRELDRSEFAGEGKTIEGEIVGTSEWAKGEPIILRVRTPLGDSIFTEELAVPAADEPLGASKFGRILEDHGYSRSQATHLVGDEVECSYDGEWSIVDPALFSPPVEPDESAAKTASLREEIERVLPGSSFDFARLQWLFSASKGEATEEPTRKVRRIYTDGVVEMTDGTLVGFMRVPWGSPDDSVKEVIPVMAPKDTE